VRFLQTDALPSHCLGQARWTVLSNEDIASEIKSRIVEKSKEGFVKAEDVVDLVASREMQVTFSEKGICKPSISKRTATRWLQKLDWRYQKTQNGMYIDGHEREDVVAYRCYVPCLILVLRAHLCFPYFASFLICTYRTALPLIPD
jgi:hypothetical protein